ncbi:hypothetical protein BC826DRAFT_1049762, partial [Russula brevipes]
MRSQATKSLLTSLSAFIFFLQRLNRYTGIPLSESPDMVELLGKSMAQVLSILALSTKTM